MTRSLKFQIYEVEELYYVAKTKALISYALDFQYAKSLLSNDSAQFVLSLTSLQTVSSNRFNSVKETLYICEGESQKFHYSRSLCVHIVIYNERMFVFIILYNFGMH